MAFGKYLQGVLDVGSPVFFSFAVAWLVALFHLKNLRLGSVFQNLSTLIKLLLIAALIVAGFFVYPKQPIDFWNCILFRNGNNVLPSQRESHAMRIDRWDQTIA